MAVVRSSSCESQGLKVWQGPAATKSVAINATEIRISLIIVRSSETIHREITGILIERPIGIKDSCTSQHLDAQPAQRPWTRITCLANLVSHFKMNRAERRKV